MNSSRITHDRTHDPITPDRTRHDRIAPLLALGCLSAAAATAQEVPQLPTVEVNDTRGYSAAKAENTARTATPLDNLPASIQVVPHEVLRDRGVTRTDQLLENVSGVLAESSYGGNGATFFNIRGLSENNGLRDGFRNFGYFAFRDVQNIDRVEVFKGPAGALYGGVGAVGGYVNTVSKRPMAENVGDIGLTVGAHGLARPTFDINRALDGDLRLRVNGAAERNAGFRDNAGSDSWSIAPAITWDDRHGTSLTLLTEFNHLNREGFDFGIPNVPGYQSISRTRYFGLRDGTFPGVAGDVGRNDTRSATLLFTRALPGDWQWRLGAHYTSARQRSTQTFPNSTTPDGTQLDFTTYAGADEASKQYALQAELTGGFATGGLTHSLLAGIDYGYLEQGGQGSAASALTLDLFDPTFVSAFTPVTTYPSHQGQGKDLGLSVQDLVELTPQVKLQAALRADRFVNHALVSGAQTGTNAQTTFSPRVGLVWQPVQGTSLFTDWSRSHAPNVGHSASENAYDAEVAEQTEVGVKQALIDRRLHATLAVFDLKRANILTTDPLDATRQVLAGRQSSKGVEIDAVGTLAAGWKVMASYTYTDAVVDSDTSLPAGDRLSNVPRHHASLWSAYEFQALPGLGVGGGAYCIGEREANLPNTYTLPGYVRIDATAYYEQGPWRTQLNVLNLFDRHYVTGGSAGSFNDTLDPSRPLTAQLSLTYRF